MRGRCGFDRRRTWIAVEGADFEHLSDWRDTCDWFFRELANAESYSASQLAIQVHWAAAHAGDHAGVFGLGPAEANQDDVALGTVGILEDTEHFHVHGFRFRALKHGVGYAMHSGMDLLDRNGFDRLGSLGLGYGREYEAENSKGQSVSLMLHYRYTHRFSPQENRQPVPRYRVTLRLRTRCRVGEEK